MIQYSIDASSKDEDTLDEVVVRSSEELRHDQRHKSATE